MSGIDEKPVERYIENCTFLQKALRDNIFRLYPSRLKMVEDMRVGDVWYLSPIIEEEKEDESFIRFTSEDGYTTTYDVNMVRFIRGALPVRSEYISEARRALHIMVFELEHDNWALLAPKLRRG